MSDDPRITDAMVERLAACFCAWQIVSKDVDRAWEEALPVSDIHRDAARRFLSANLASLGGSAAGTLHKIECSHCHHMTVVPIALTTTTPTAVPLKATHIGSVANGANCSCTIHNCQTCAPESPPLGAGGDGVGWSESDAVRAARQGVVDAVRSDRLLAEAGVPHVPTSVPDALDRVCDAVWRAARAHCQAGGREA